jgi:ATP-dependent Clp protease ATP-binding subunit ClpX
LLKLMEDTEVSVRNPMDIQSQMQAMFQMRAGTEPTRDSVRTRHILFIVSGAFSGLDEIISRRVGRKSIGFEAMSGQNNEGDSLFREASTRDFLDYGFEAEFIGRLPVRVVCDPLKAEDLCEIMENSEGSLIRQYEREFEAYGLKAAFERSALEAIAARAVTEETGARGLMTVCEAILRDFKFELADSGVTELKIDRELVDHPDKVLARYLEACGDSDSQEVQKEILTFCAGFRDKYGLDLVFDLDAMHLVNKRCSKLNMSALAWCEQSYDDYQFGLKLIQKNKGRHSFRLPVRAVEDPEGFLSDLVLKSYRMDEQPKVE